MKSSIKVLIGFALAITLSSWPCFLFASQPAAPALTEYSFPNLKQQPILKWPRGSLIFPETNNPHKTDEVFLLGESLIPGSQLHSLHHHYGSQFFSRKMHSQAKKEYLTALKLQANSSDIHKRLGLIYLKSKDYKGAESAYRKALELDPGYTPAIAKLGICLAAQKKYSLAEKKFKQAVRADPSNANYHLNMGHFYYYLMKNYRGARNSYQRALKLNPRLTEARSNMRDINRKFRKWKEQENDFNNSWGSDFDYDGSKDSQQVESKPRHPEEDNIAGAWEEENTQRPLF